MTKVTRAQIRKWHKIADQATFADMYSSSVRTPRFEAYLKMLEEIPFQFMADMLKQQLGVQDKK